MCTNRNFNENVWQSGERAKKNPCKYLIYLLEPIFNLCLKGHKLITASWLLSHTNGARKKVVCEEIKETKNVYTIVYTFAHCSHCLRHTFLWGVYKFYDFLIVPLSAALVHSQPFSIALFLWIILFFFPSRSPALSFSTLCRIQSNVKIHIIVLCIRKMRASNHSITV